MRPSSLIAFLFLSLVAFAFGQEPSQPALVGEGETSLADRLWLSGQLNVVNQSYPSFPAAYSGPNSLRNNAEQATTWVATIYTGFAITSKTEFFFDVESARGVGVSGALGLGGLLNLDAVTEPNAPATPYIARAQIRQIIPLGLETEQATRNPLGLATSVPVKRLELRLGKMSATDFFDLNAVGNDSHLQFLNYALDNNAAYDFPADSRGYTYGVLFELYHPGWVARFGEMLEPTDPSGNKLNWNLTKAHSENYEFELHRTLIPKHEGIVRFLAFMNHAEMASYAEAVSAYLSGEDPKPDLAAHIKPDQMNYGFGVNGEQEINDNFRLFGRYGWNIGTEEAYQFAEADRTFAIGADLGGKRWHREQDRIGLATAVNGLVYAHRRYLELGGVSYLLGDGGLNYALENVVEGYYNCRLRPGVFVAFDVQHVQNPGYNSARGPVWIFGVRLHLEGDIRFN
jgi:high affinity Mn2+ porin